MTNPKPKWQRNNLGGYSLMVWHVGAPYTYKGSVIYEGFPGYRDMADVFKPKKGNVWVARWRAQDPRRWQQASTPTLREAMRLARFMAATQGATE